MYMYMRVLCYIVRCIWIDAWKGTCMHVYYNSIIIIASVPGILLVFRLVFLYIGQ